MKKQINQVTFPGRQKRKKLFDNHETIDEVIRLADWNFEPQHRDAVKVYCLQLHAGLTAKQSIKLLSLNGRKLNSYPLEVSHKCANDQGYQILFKSFCRHIEQTIQHRRLTIYKKHIKQVTNQKSK